MTPDAAVIRNAVEKLGSIDEQIMELRNDRKKLLENFKAGGGRPFVLRHVLHLRKMDVDELAKLDEAERAYRLALDIHVAELGPTPLEAAIDKAEPPPPNGGEAEPPARRARGRARDPVINIGALS